MPVVPTISGPSVRGKPLQGGMQRSIASKELFLHDSGAKATGEALTAVAGAFEAYTKRDDMDKAFRAEVALKSEWMTADAELRKRFRGSSVDGYVEEAKKWWDESPTKFGSELSPGARAIASRPIMAARLHAQSTTQEYFTQEKDRSQTEAWEAAKGVAIQDAGTDMRPKVVATTRRNLELKNAEYAATRGWDADQLAVQNLKDAGVLHGVVIGKLQDTDPEAAKAYYSANKTEIDVRQHTSIEKALDSAVNEKEGKRMADSLAGKPYDEVLQELAEIENPELRKVASFHARQNQADIASAVTAREKDASDKVWQFVAKGAGLSQLPASLLSQMDGKERVQVVQHYNAEAKRRLVEAEGRAVKTDMRVLDNVYNLPDDQFLKLRISTLADKLSRADTRELIKHQAKLRDPEKVPDVASMEQQVGAAAAGLKNERAGAFKSAVYRDLNAAAAANGGKEPTFDEREKIIDRLRVAKDKFWSADKQFFEVKGTPEEKDFLDGLTIDDVPHADRGLITDSLKRGGYPVTDKNVTDVFRKKLGTKK